jgi:MYXO-CTERM domain-containing protein
VADRLVAGDHYWHARVGDGDMLSSWSATSSFTVRLPSGDDAGGPGDGAGEDAGSADATGDDGGGGAVVDAGEPLPEEGCCRVGPVAPSGGDRGGALLLAALVALVVGRRRCRVGR